MLDDIKTRLNTPPREGNAKVMVVDVQSWWRSGQRIAGHQNESPREQLEAWGEANGFETFADATKGTVTFVKKHNYGLERPAGGNHEA